jgi:ADP-ribosylglycohydrolase
MKDLEILKRSEKTRLENIKEGRTQRLEVLEKSYWVHTLPNISFIIIGLLYGDGDMIQTVRIATESGMDTDCNAGNAGAILGAYLGLGLISPYAKRFVRNEMLPALNDWDVIPLDELAKRTIIQKERIDNILKNH